ncbi:MAG: hypothetical protein K9N10_15155 [Deltaproteobacteria bacterium]|nr:hypothetical protein [Deltaproteobacteria bacterium]
MRRILIALFVVLLTAAFSPVEATDTKRDRNQLIVWLIPFDPPFETALAEEQMPVKKQNELQACPNLDKSLLDQVGDGVRSEETATRTPSRPWPNSKSRLRRSIFQQRFNGWVENFSTID